MKQTQDTWRPPCPNCAQRDHDPGEHTADPDRAQATLGPTWPVPASICPTSCSYSEVQAPGAPACVLCSTQRPESSFSPVGGPGKRVQTFPGRVYGAGPFPGPPSPCTWSHHPGGGGHTTPAGPCPQPPSPTFSPAEDSSFLTRAAPDNGRKPWLRLWPAGTCGHRDSRGCVLGWGPWTLLTEAWVWGPWDAGPKWPWESP